MYSTYRVKVWSTYTCALSFFLAYSKSVSDHKQFQIRARHYLPKVSAARSYRELTLVQATKNDFFACFLFSLKKKSGKKTACFSFSSLWAWLDDLEIAEPTPIIRMNASDGTWNRGPQSVTLPRTAFYCGSVRHHSAWVTVGTAAGGG